MDTKKRKIIDDIRNGNISLADIDKELKEIEKHYPNFFIENCNRINL